MMNLKKVAVIGAVIIGGGAYVYHSSASALNFSRFKSQMEGQRTVLKSFNSRNGEWLGLWRVGNRASWNAYERSRCDIYTISDDGSTVIAFNDGRVFSLGRPSWGKQAASGTINLSIAGVPYGKLSITSVANSTTNDLQWVNASLPTSFFGEVGRAVRFWGQITAGGNLEFWLAGETVSKRIDPFWGNFARGAMKECYDLLDNFK